MRFAIIAPDVPTKRWKENFERIAPKIPLLIGENTDKLRTFTVRPSFVSSLNQYPIL